MSLSPNNFAIDQMTTDEKLDLLGKIWDDLIDSNSLPPIPASHQLLLEDRIREADENPDTGIPLEVLRKEFLGDAEP